MKKRIRQTIEVISVPFAILFLIFVVAPINLMEWIMDKRTDKDSFWDFITCKKVKEARIRFEKQMKYLRDNTP